MKKLFKKTGQFTIGAAIISALGLLGGSVFTAWATASKANSDLRTEITEVRGYIGIVEEREKNHYDELKSDTEAILEILREK